MRLRIRKRKMNGCFLILVLEIKLFSEDPNNTLFWISENLNSFNSKDKGSFPPY